MRAPFPSPVVRSATVALLAAAALPGCSIFTSYPSATADFRRDFERGRFAEAAKGYGEEASGGDELLYRLEEGMAWHAGGRFEKSREALAAADRVVEGFESRPDVSGRSIGEGVASAVLNDKTLPYDGAGFERVMICALQAVNYWMLGDLEGALVEVRRAAERQRFADEIFDPPSEESPPENVFSQYLGALLREFTGDLDGAFVDYRAIHARAPGLALVRRDLLRIAEATGRIGDLERFRAEFDGLAPSRSIATERDSGAGEIVVLASRGMAPQKEAIEIPVPTGTTLTKVSIPRYRSSSGAPVSIVLLVDGAEVARTEVLEDVDAIARDHLSRRIGWIIAKSAGRAAARAVVSEVGVRALHHNDQHAAAIAVAIGATIWNLVVEQADLRSWLTLPRDLQVARAVVPAGVRALRLEVRGAGDTLVAAADLGRVEVRAGRPLPVSARAIGSRLFAHVPSGAGALPEDSSRNRYSSSVVDPAAPLENRP